MPCPCQHARCINCYDCDPDKERIQHYNKDLYPRLDLYKYHEAHGLNAESKTKFGASPKVATQMAEKGFPYGYGALGSNTAATIELDPAITAIAMTEPDKSCPVSLYANPLD
jgi:hypothetical protein